MFSLQTMFGKGHCLNPSVRNLNVTMPPFVRNTQPLKDQKVTMPTPSLYEASLQRAIDLIRSKIIDMGRRAERALQDSLNALVERNRQLAYSVILRDQFIDDAEKELDRLCLEFLVRQQPVAGHLRFVYAALKINNELERIGDYAESVARQVLKVSSLEPQPPFAKFTELANVSMAMLRDTIKAFVDRDAELARRSMHAEEVADALRDDINADLVRLRQENKLPLEAWNPYMTIARRYERVADQARNMCEEVLYMCTGEYLKHLGTEVFRILFVDEYNSGRSQMAEAIGNSLGERNFVFSSAGLDPHPPDPKTLAFMAKKGIDISRQTSNSVEQTPNIDHYQVIVALAPEARTVFPSPPTKTVCLDWSVNDPSKTQGSPAEVEAAYEETFRYIRSHIQDLVQAMIGENSNNSKP